MATSNANANPLAQFLTDRLNGRRPVDVWRQLKEQGSSIHYTLVTRWFRDGPTGRCVSLWHVESLARAMGLSEADRLEMLRLAADAPDDEPSPGPSGLDEAV